MAYQGIVLVALAVIAVGSAACAKSGSTLRPPDQVANARRNIERYAWARAMRDKVVAEADKFASQPDDFLWELVTPQSIPRGIEVNMTRGCPGCGVEVKKFGNYPWKVDVFKRPWKIECPSCGEAFPKNDFGKFYESGKDSDGVFHADRADRSLLFNTDHPDPADPLHTYGVDDGMGFKDDKGDVFRFIGYYGHYGAWTAVRQAVGAFRDAYILTGDPKYARKAGLMLYRVAQFYPDMDWAYWRKLGFFNSDGGNEKGKVMGRIWETDLAKSLVSAYDAIWPALGDPELLAYLSKKTGQTATCAGVRALMDKNLLHEVHDEILAGNIAGNEGMHQTAMAAAAIALDDPVLTRQWLDWVFAPGDLVHGDPSGGNILRLFETRIDEDGMGDEASPAYNSIWRTLFRQISETVSAYPRYRGPDIAKVPKYRKMFETPARLICIGKFIPLIGDTGSTGSPGFGVSADEMVYAYRTFKDPFFAQMAWFLNGNKANGLHGGLYEAEPEAVVAEIEAEVAKHGHYAAKTENLPSYGLALLRGGKAENARALSLYYGRNTGHGHRDTLNIELFAHGLDLLPDLGYPEYATLWPSRYEWTGHTISHNTVTIDRRAQANNRCGVARFVADGDGVSAAEVYAGKPYPQASLYQRTVAMVDVSDSDFYIVDVFRVKGGKEHYYSIHGPDGEIETEGLKLTAQPKGTFAGEDIAFGADLGGRENAWRDSSGFQYLYDIRRDSAPPALSAVTWKVKDTWKLLKEPKDIRLRVNLLSPPGELVLAHGDPPRNKPGNPRRLEYIILPHTGDEVTYVTVIEPYVGTRFIESIERTDDGSSVTLKVALASGRIDYITTSLEPRGTKLGGVELDGRFGIVSEESGKAVTRLIVK